MIPKFGATHHRLGKRTFWGTQFYSKKVSKAGDCLFAGTADW